MPNKKIKQQKIVRYLNKDFDAFRSDILEFARAHFPDTLKDFSDPSVPGMFLDFYAYVGDVMSHYIDHQFNELFIDSVREPRNVKRIAKQLGMKPNPPTPSSVLCSFFVEAPVTINSNGTPVPDSNSLFILKAGSVCSSDNGIPFELQDDLDFSKIDNQSQVEVSQRDANGVPTHIFIKKDGLCISGERKTFTITIPNKYKKFRKVELPEKNITEIIKVTDSDNNMYYNVDYLTQDTVFEVIDNDSIDKSDVPLLVKIKPVPYRFTSEYDIENEKTTLTFGAGQAGTIDDDIVPDPSEFAIPLFGKTTLTRFSVNPEQFLKTRTMGVAPMGTTLSIEARVGGGLAHNVVDRTINSMEVSLISALSTDTSAVNAVVQTLDVTNFARAGGGDDKQTLAELKANASSNFASQNRLVTREDYLARIYSMPAKFGRVFRAMVSPNSVTNQSIQIHILSRNEAGALSISPDALKMNMKTFINEFRIITDSIDILDAEIINIGLDFRIIVNSKSNKTVVLNNIMQKLTSFFDIENWQIGQPIIIDEVKSLIYNTEHVISVARLEFKNIVGTSGGKKYSDTVFPIARNTKDGLILSPENAIFEVLFPNDDLRGAAV